MASSAVWEVLPVRLGTMLVDTSQLLRGTRAGVKIEIPCIAWILRGSDGVVVVDTGPADAEWSEQFHNPMYRPSSESVPEAFLTAGVDVRDVEVVVNTHLHWDHCYGNEFFTKARFYVQRSEVQYSERPHPCDRPIYEAGEKAPFQRVASRFAPVDGRTKIANGLELIPTPGHTPGHQGVLVQGGNSRIFIAGDAVGLYENLEGNGKPGALYTDLTDWYQSIEAMRSLADVVLPGHDPLVFKEAVYT